MHYSSFHHIFCDYVSIHLVQCSMLCIVLDNFENDEQWVNCNNEAMHENFRVNLCNSYWKDEQIKPSINSPLIHHIVLMKNYYWRPFINWFISGYSLLASTGCGFWIEWTQFQQSGPRSSSFCFNLTLLLIKNHSKSIHYMNCELMLAMLIKIIVRWWFIAEWRTDKVQVNLIPRNYTSISCTVHAFESWLLAAELFLIDLLIFSLLLFFFGSFVVLRRFYFPNIFYNQFNKFKWILRNTCLVWFILKLLNMKSCKNHTKWNQRYVGLL